MQTYIILIAINALGLSKTKIKESRKLIQRHHGLEVFSSGFGLIGTKLLHFSFLSAASKKVNIFLTMRAYSSKKLAKDRKLKRNYTVLLSNKWFKKSMFCSLFSQIIPIAGHNNINILNNAVFGIKQFIDTRRKLEHSNKAYFNSNERNTLSYLFLWSVSPVGKIILSYNIMFVY